MTKTKNSDGFDAALLVGPETPGNFELIQALESSVTSGGSLIVGGLEFQVMEFEIGPPSVATLRRIEAVNATVDHPEAPTEPVAAAP